MGALSIAGFRFQKRGERLARYSRQRLLPYVSAPETVRKHHKLTSELRCFSNAVISYEVHHYRWLI